VLVSIDGSVIVAVLIGCPISFSSFPGPHISEKLEIFYTVGPDTIGMILAFFGQLAPHLRSVDSRRLGAGVHPQFRPTFPAPRCASTLVIDHSVRNALVNSPRKAASFTSRKIDN